MAEPGADGFTVVIPARHASTRLPGKPLLDLGGVPMVVRVWQQASRSAASRVVVATDDARIEAACREAGATVVMTRDDHPSGTDRLAEVAAHLELDDQAILVNVQGDEPLLPPAVVDQVAGLLAATPEAAAATLCTPISGVDELADPNAVKVVADTRGLALYFSRAPLPWARDAFADGMPATLPPAAAPFRRHLGIYAYRAGVLRQFVSWPPSALETTECLEQLRLLEQGARIAVAEACSPVPGGVDTPEDLQRVRALLA